MSTLPALDRKFKILCLHGIGTNSEILESQTAALRQQLGCMFEWDFIEGGHPWPAAKNILEAFGHHQICYSYYDGTAQSVKAAIDDLATYVIEQGPFDAIFGFSLGAAMAATFLLSQEHESAHKLIKSAIFLCATLPCEWGGLLRGKIQPLHSADVDDACKIRVPSVHVWSPDDIDYPGESSEVHRMCVSTGRTEVVHTAGHSIPFQGDRVVAIAEAISATMAEIHRPSVSLQGKQTGFD